MQINMVRCGLLLCCCREIQLRGETWQSKRTHHLNAGFSVGLEVNKNCIHGNRKTRYWTDSLCPPHIKHHWWGIMGFYCVSWTWRAVEEERKECRDFLLFYIQLSFQLNGRRKGKQGLNGTFHMWSNSGLTPGYEYHLSVGCLVGLLLSCVSLKSKDKKTNAELFSFYKAAKNMVEFSNHLFQCSKAIILLLESNINVSPVNLLQVILYWVFPHG